MQILFIEGTTHCSERSAVSQCHYTVLLEELLTTQNAVQSVQLVSVTILFYWRNYSERSAVCAVSQCHYTVLLYLLLMSALPFPVNNWT